MKILIDAGVGRLVAERLAEAGHDVVDAMNQYPHMADLNLLDIANSEDRFIITMDKDFGELAYLSNLPHAGILLLRMEDASGAEKADAVEMIFAKHADKLPSAFAVYQKNRLRIRPQP